MAANILALIQFDDNTSESEPPFKNEASLWNLESDYGLWGCKDYGFIGAISGVRNQSGKEPLIPLRGWPGSGQPAFRELQDEPFVGFLSYSEIILCLKHHDLSVDGVHRSIQNVLDVLHILSRRYGDERVRLVFAIQV
jgi:hypothetical protein